MGPSLTVGQRRLYSVLRQPVLSGRVGTVTESTAQGFRFQDLLLFPQLPQANEQEPSNPRPAVELTKNILMEGCHCASE